jgi:hypothetical protein
VEDSTRQLWASCDNSVLVAFAQGLAMSRLHSVIYCWFHLHRGLANTSQHHEHAPGGRKILSATRYISPVAFCKKSLKANICCIAEHAVGS